jgi:hypothetical protein
MAGLLLRNTVKGGMLGMFGWPAEAMMTSKQYYGGQPKETARILGEKFLPPAVSTGKSAVEASMAKRGKKIKTFTEKEFPLIRRLNKR